MKFRDRYTCPLEIVHDILRGKWKTVILYQIDYYGDCSLSRLEKDISGITQKVLLEQLNELMFCSLVKKHKYDGYPLKVEYMLTEKGKRLIPALDIMQEVGIEIIKEHNCIIEKFDDAYPQKSK